MQRWKLGDNMFYTVGIDVGSTTLKTVVLNEKNQILEKSYQRHFSQVRESAAAQWQTLEPLLRGHRIKVAITGSAGLGIAKNAEIDFVQEVFATSNAVRCCYPDADVVIELGGEDAKILFLRGAPEERMNGTCAGGTGAFIDQMATLLDVTVDELDELSACAQKIYPIASRCGVFAKSDIQPLLNQGARKEDLAASIFQAVVDQTITGLAQGREITGNVLFLGGPLSFSHGLRRRFIETLGLEEGHAKLPPLAPYFVALGAAYHAETLPAAAVTTYEKVLECLQKAPAAATGNRLPPLFSGREEYDRFQARHAKMNVATQEIAAYTGKAYLGIDCGSTTTKLVLVDQNYNLLYRYYSSNKGNPVTVVREQLGKIRSLCGERIAIAASAVTGYGEELVQVAFGVDFGIVETVAHYTAARHFDPEVDFIIDIGGQDIKCFTIQDRTVDSVILNEACSSGCGSFIETFAKSLDYDIEEFSKLALLAEEPVDLGSRCTVFMNSSVKQAQKDGASVGDISAGLAISVIKNALYKVIRARSAEDLGEHIVVQGGTFLNDAVLRSFEQELGREVVRLGISELMGAYGAALYAMEHINEQVSGLIDMERLTTFTHSATAASCKKCTNRCALTINTFAQGVRFISGNKCEKGAGAAKCAKLPNMMQYKYERILHYPLPSGRRQRIGIPLVLNMYENLPFWVAFFQELGCELVLSGRSSRKLYMKGQQTIPSDTVCYPAKLVHGHIEELVEQGVDAVFYPCMSYSFHEGLADNAYNCPVVAYYPENIQANMASVLGVRFIKPHISLNNPAHFAKRIFGVLQPIISGLTKREIQTACTSAYRAQDQWRQEIREQTEQALQFAQEKEKSVIVMASRPYHVDPQINHGIDKLLTSLGYVVVTEDGVAPLSQKYETNVLNQWTYHARMYAAAHFTGRHQNMEMVQLVSFGCGIDAVTSDEVRDILRAYGKLYTQLKIDEISNLGAVKIRLRSLQAAMEERKGERVAR